MTKGLHLTASHFSLNMSAMWGHFEKMPHHSILVTDSAPPTEVWSNQSELPVQDSQEVIFALNCNSAPKSSSILSWPRSGDGVRCYLSSWCSSFLSDRSTLLFKLPSSRWNEDWQKTGNLPRKFCPHCSASHWSFWLLLFTYFSSLYFSIVAFLQRVYIAVLKKAPHWLDSE